MGDDTGGFAPIRRINGAFAFTLECPDPMLDPVRYVLEGEYESHHDGYDLNILDIGANVGSFALWAVRRWPGSRVTSYEPNPETFAMLSRNTAGCSLITPVNAAVYPGLEARAGFFARYAGDGEAGLVAYIGETFRADVVEPTFMVDVVRPESLPSADIVKIDIEGGEGDVIATLDLSKTALVLAEFQNLRGRTLMQTVLGDNGFEVIVDEGYKWDDILGFKLYRPDLEGNQFGRMFYRKRGQTRLIHRPPPA